MQDAIQKLKKEAISIVKQIGTATFERCNTEPDTAYTKGVVNSDVNDLLILATNISSEVQNSCKEPIKQTKTHQNILATIITTIDKNTTVTLSLAKDDVDTIKTSITSQ